MTSLSYRELLTAVRRDGEAILAAAGQGLDVPVPTCGEWRMPKSPHGFARDLPLHVGIQEIARRHRRNFLM